jgi:hypothetical protein
MLTMLIACRTLEIESAFSFSLFQEGEVFSSRHAISSVSSVGGISSVSSVGTKRDGKGPSSLALQASPTSPTSPRTEKGSRHDAR